MKNAVFWGVTPCGCCKNRRFGGTYLHHQGGNVGSYKSHAASHPKRRHSLRYMTLKLMFDDDGHIASKCTNCE
jgi:hypothetical protein